MNPPRSPGIVVALAIAAVSLAAAGAVLGPAVSGGPTRHANGEGPLASADYPWSLGLERRTPDQTWSLGIYVCAADPSVPVTLTDVTPTDPVGAYRFLGAKVRRFTPGPDDLPMFGMDGYPPAVPDALADVAGFEVAAGCDLASRDADYTEIVLGLGADGTQGGGWHGEEIRYTSGGRDYVLVLEDGMAVCGPGAPPDICASPPSPDASASVENATQDAFVEAWVPRAPEPAAGEKA